MSVWALLPVKRPASAKSRLAGLLTVAQRRRLSLLMAEDVLAALDAAAAVAGVTVISCDDAVLELADDWRAETLDTGSDHGHIEDLLRGVSSLADRDVEKALILPADVPEVTAADLARLERAHQRGITLCPAARGGGTNALVFTPPLPLDLQFGRGSFARFEQAAARAGVPLTRVICARPARDIDRPADLRALRRRPRGGRAWRYARSLDL